MKQLIHRISQNGILKSSAGLLIITILVKILGYVEKLVLANYYGTSYQVDVYTVILTLILSLFFFFREIVEPGYLNVFLIAKEYGEDKVAWNLFNMGLRIIFAITLILSIVSILFPQNIIGIFAPGFDDEKLHLSVSLIRIAFPACVFLALSTLTSITLNGMKIFVLPASGELVFKGLIILCMVVLYKEYGIIGAAIGIVLGSIGRFLVHMVKLYKNISFTKIRIEKKYKNKIWILTWPLLIGVGFSQISSLVDNVFASYLQEGAIAALSYAKKVVEMPVIIFPYVISIVVFPYFSQLAIEKKHEKLKNLLVQSLRWIVIAFLPITIFFLVYSTSIVEIIFERGAFNANSTMLTSRPFFIYSIGLIFFAIETILVIFYYGNMDTKTPVFVGMACVVLNIVLTFIFIQFIGYLGIALAFVIQKIVKNLILLYLLKNKISYNSREILNFSLKLIVPILVTIFIMGGSKIFVLDKFSQNTFLKIGFLMINFILGGSIYLLLLFKSGLLKVNNEEVTY